ncbi:MAG: flippase-like domain-containing protein [Synergistaceae bacterium]|nr:flippase-like domain-containing protein [Synergistaceae bacterium]
MLLLRIFISVACLAYVLWGIDLGLLFKSLSSYPIYAVPVTAIIFFVNVILQALRLSLLFERRLPFWGSLKSVIIGLGLNNILPAKGGEIAKIMYINKSCGKSASESFACVACERFFDANFLYIFSALMLREWLPPSAISKIGVFFVACWGAFVYFRFFPHVFERIWAKIPKIHGSEFLNGLKKSFLYELTARKLFVAAIMSLVVWLSYGFYSLYVFLILGNLRLNFFSAITVFLISAAGQLLPSSPGSLGVFEASVVWGMSLFGVEREAALGVAFLLRVIQFLPTLAAIFIFFKTPGFSIFKKRDTHF